MSKEEYFASCLKRDFIRFVLLRKPRFTNRDVSLKLRGQIAPGYLCDKVDALVDGVIRQAVEGVDAAIKAGAVCMSQPGWLGNLIATELKRVFEKAVSDVFDVQKAISRLTDVIEQLTWLQGVDDMAANLRAFVGDLKDDMRSMSDLDSGSVRFDYELERKFDEARHISLRERVMGDNYIDVLELSSAVNAFAKDECKRLMYRHVAEFYSRILADFSILGYISAFETAHRIANIEIEKLVVPNVEVEWADEYK